MTQKQMIILGAAALAGLWYLNKKEQERREAEAAALLAAQNAQSAGTAQPGTAESILGGIGDILGGIGRTVDAATRTTSSGG